MSKTKSSKRRLGRGLDGLLPKAPSIKRATNTARIEELRPGRGQPRSRFDDDALTELADSIRAHGVLEPILVRQVDGTAGFEIIAGERRWRAAQRAGLRDVPVFVRDLSDQAAFEAALVENLQREDLNPIETARAFQRLVDEFGHTQEQVAQRVGKKRSTVANGLRLLKLPEEVLDLVEQGQLSEGHGRALLGSDSPEAICTLARTVVAGRLSVRETERRAKRREKPKAVVPASKSANVKDLERRLGHALGVTVSLQAGKGERGTLVLAYASYDELDELTQKLLR